MATGLASDDLLVLAVMALTGAFVSYLGYRIRYRGDVHLVAGYPRDRPVDDDALARVVGRITLAVGALTLAFGLASPFVETGLLYWGLYTLLVLALGAYSMVATREFVGDLEGS